MLTLPTRADVGPGAPVQLPYHWDHHHPGQQGRATFVLQFEFDHVPRGPQGLYLERVGNAYEVWVNGWLMDHQGDMSRHDGSNFGHVPRYLGLPPGLLRTQNEVIIHVRADVGRRAGLSPVHMGPADEVLPRYQRAYLWRFTGSAVVVSVSIIVGILALVLWSTQHVSTGLHAEKRRDPLYLSAAVAELAWTIRVGDVLIEQPPLAWPWWGLVPVAALGVWGVAIGSFCVQVAGWRDLPRARQFVRWLLLMAVLSVPAAAGALVWGKPLSLTLWYGLLGVGFVAMAAVFVWRALWPSAGLPHRLVALTVVVNVCVGLRDFYVFRVEPVHGQDTYLRFASLLFGLVLAFIVLYRFKRATDQARDLNKELAARVHAREQELLSSYRRLEDLVREQARVAERARILRDMHDGVGSHISSAVRLLQSEQPNTTELKQTLQDALDHLKLSIDAIHLGPGDVGALLANLRYRLQPRFAAMGLALDWQVDALPVIARLSASDTRQLQFLLFEALSNVLQHAQAATLCVQAHASGDGLVLRIIDDGIGFDPPTARTRGRGLASMHERAQAIGAGLTVCSRPGRTELKLELA